METMGQYDSLSTSCGAESSKLALKRRTLVVVMKDREGPGTRVGGGGRKAATEVRVAANHVPSRQMPRADGGLLLLTNMRSAGDIDNQLELEAPPGSFPVNKVAAEQ